MSQVCVLMATYNGASYLKEQIDSILRQACVTVDLQVRDDGSTDETLSILEDYQADGLLQTMTGDGHLGPAYGFLHLLRHSNEARYYAFSDQDDYWQEDKLHTAVSSLEPYGDKPCLYFSRTQLVDATLHPIHSADINPLLTFGESLIYEFIPGCTMVMNKSLRDIVNRYTPDYLPMHDVWIYSIAQAIGAQIVFDKQPHILYRQHATNAIGQGYSRWHELKRQWKRLADNEQSRSRRAKELLTGYKEMIGNENLELLSRFVKGKEHARKRLKLCCDKDLRCARKDTQLLFWVNLLINKY